MTRGSRKALEAQLVRHERVVLHAYRDSLGYWTIGCGRLIDPAKGGGISYAEAMHLLDRDIDKVVAGLYQRFPWIVDLDEPRRIVLANMAFQLGIDGLAKFTRTLTLIREGDYARASTEMLDSLWAKQTPNRAQELAEIMRTGALKRG